MIRIPLIFLSIEVEFMGKFFNVKKIANVDKSLLNSSKEKYSIKRKF